MTTYKQLFMTWLDELVPVPFGCSFSVLLEKADPALFYQAFRDFTDDGRRFICARCGEELGEEDAWGAELDEEIVCAKCKREA